MSAAGAAAGAAAIENENYQRLFMSTFPGTVFLDPRTICSCFEINDVWEFSRKKVEDDVRVVASLQFHSLQILSPVPEGQTGVYHANLEYEDVADVTRITGADLVPQHAYYYLVMKIYELFLHPAASESMFRGDMEHIADFITEQLNSGLADGRAFFEDKIKRFLKSDNVFLKSTNPQKLQNNINAIWDLLRSDEYKNAGSTVQKGIVSTISPHDVEEYSLESQGKVTAAAKAAFKKTVYGFHVLVYVGGHVISMSLSREDLFRAHPGTMISFFNSDMIKYMDSDEFMKQVYGIIGKYNTSKGNKHHELVELLRPDKPFHLTFLECGCKSPGLFHYNSTGIIGTKLSGRREYYVGMNEGGNRYVFVDNFPFPGSNIQLFVTSEDHNLPNFCEYNNMAAVHRVLDIVFGPSSNSQSSTTAQLSQSQTTDSPTENDKEMVNASLLNALQGAPTVQEVVPVADPGAAVAAQGAAVATVEPSDGFVVKVMSGVGAACNFIRGIFFPTPTCSAKNYANIGFRDHVVFCVPTNSEDIAIKELSRPESTRWDVVKAKTSLSWLKAREFFLGMDYSPQGGRRPISRKDRNVKKNISRKKEKKRMSLRHRRSRRRLRRRYRSLCLKKLK